MKQHENHDTLLFILKYSMHLEEHQHSQKCHVFSKKMKLNIFALANNSHFTMLAHENKSNALTKWRG